MTSDVSRRQTVVTLPSADAPADGDHARRAAGESFHRRLAPLLSVATDAERFPHLSDVFVDGERVVVAQGSDRQGFTFADFPGLSPAVLQAAVRNAAVYKDVEFGPRRPHFSVRMPPDLRVTCARPPIAETWHLAIRFLRARELTLDDYAEAGHRDRGRAGRAAGAGARAQERARLGRDRRRQDHPAARPAARDRHASDGCW